MEHRQTLWGALTCADQGLTDRDRRNQWVATGWSFAWMLTFLAATLLIEKELVSGNALWGVALVPTIVGVGAILVYRRFLVQADELQRKIQLGALASGFGVALVGSFGLELIEEAGGFGFALSAPMIPAILAYVIAILVSVRRFS